MDRILPDRIEKRTPRSIVFIVEQRLPLRKDLVICVDGKGLLTDEIGRIQSPDRFPAQPRRLRIGPSGRIGDRIQHLRHLIHVEIVDGNGPIHRSAVDLIGHIGTRIDLADLRLSECTEIDRALLHEFSPFDKQPEILLLILEPGRGLKRRIRAFPEPVHLLRIFIFLFQITGKQFPVVVGWIIVTRLIEEFVCQDFRPVFFCEPGGFGPHFPIDLPSGGMHETVRCPAVECRSVTGVARLFRNIALLAPHPAVSQTSPHPFKAGDVDINRQSAFPDLFLFRTDNRRIPQLINVDRFAVFLQEIGRNVGPDKVKPDPLQRIIIRELVIQPVQRLRSPRNLQTVRPGVSHRNLCRKEIMDFAIDPERAIRSHFQFAVLLIADQRINLIRFREQRIVGKRSEREEQQQGN